MTLRMYNMFANIGLIRCHAGFTVGQASCGWFTWAEFDEDGRPPWVEGYKTNANGPNSVLDAATEQDASTDE